MSDEQDLQRLREEMRQLQQRLGEVDRKLREISTKPEPVVAAPPIQPPPVIQLPPPPIIEQPPVTERRAEESFEVRLGTYWLPRIGIVVLLTGMVFLVTWIHPRLTAPFKIALGYLCAAALGAFGLKLEKKMAQFARVLQAGGLALAYFVTYAMHFSESLRVIESPALALTLLAIVVAAIVVIADNRKSALLAGMALFFGYYTSVMSGVATFTLASNALLAAAALWFLARNRWVPISFGAVLATYLAYAIWVWRLPRGLGLERLLWDVSYLSWEDFRLRASFLSLYWLLFAGGGLMVRRDAMNVGERNGLFTLNNAFFFVLFSLLMHHAYPGLQWQFQFCFGAALLALSAAAYRRFAPERAVLDALFLQGLAVVTLGVLNYFKGTQLIAVLALESTLILLAGRWMKLQWVAWVGRAAFAAAALCAWDRMAGGDDSTFYGILFASGVGFVNARLDRAVVTRIFNPSSLYFALVSSALAISATYDHLEKPQQDWVWSAGTVIVALIGVALRTREIGWSALVPLVFGHAAFYYAKLDNHGWSLAPSLALIAVTFGFGLVMWGRARADEGADAARRATYALLPFGLAAIALVIVTTFDRAADEWMLTAFLAETFVLILAGIRSRERLFGTLAALTMGAGVLQFLWEESVVWSAALVAMALLAASERAVKLRGGDWLAEDDARRFRLWTVVLLTAVAVLALEKLASRPLLTVAWAICGFVLLAIGFTARERWYRLGGLATLGLSLGRALVYDLGKLETPYRILSFMGLGAILLVLAFLYTKNREKLSKWL